MAVRTRGRVGERPPELRRRKRELSREVDAEVRGIVGVQRDGYPGAQEATDRVRVEGRVQDRDVRCQADVERYARIGEARDECRVFGGANAMVDAVHVEQVEGIHHTFGPRRLAGMRDAAETLGAGELERRREPFSGTPGSLLVPVDRQADDTRRPTVRHPTHKRERFLARLVASSDTSRRQSARPSATARSKPRASADARSPTSHACQCVGLKITSA